MVVLVNVEDTNSELDAMEKKHSEKCVGQCPECGGVTGFDPMAIVQKKLSYGKRRRKRKFGGGCHCPGHKKFGKRFPRSHQQLLERCVSV